MAKQKHNTYYNENTPDSGIYYYNENGEAKKVDVGSTYSAGEGIKIEEKIISVSADYAYNSAVSSLHNTTLTSTDDSVEISSTTAADGTVNYDLSVEGHSDTEIVGENGISAEKVQNTSTWKVGVSADYATEEYVDDEIAKLGKPLTYSGSKTVEQINALTDVKVGTVYTIAGESGTIVSGNVECKPGDEVAWASTDEWFLIGNTISENNNSWKQWSEDNGSSGDSASVYIGEDNEVGENTYVFGSANSGNNSYIIGHNNSALDDKDPGNTAFNPAIIIGDTNSSTSGSHILGECNSAENNPYIIGRYNKARKEAFVFGKANTANMGGSTIGFYNINDTSYILGQGNTATTNAYVLGNNNYANCQSVSIGNAASADTVAFCVNIKGGGYSRSKSVAIGGSNSASNYAVSIGHNNSAESLGFCFGFQNTATNFGEAFGFNNIVNQYSFAFGSLNYLDQNCFAFGSQNRNSLKVYSQAAKQNVSNYWRNVLVGMNNGVSFGGYDYSASMSGNKNFNTEALLIGHENRLNFTENDTPYSYNYDGLMIGKSNGCRGEAVGNYYTYTGSPDGYCITIGKSNGIGSYEAINIGTKNDVVGHSIGFGWNNKTNDSYGAHSVLLGDSNSSYSDIEYLVSARNGALVTANKTKIVKAEKNIINNEDLTNIKNYANQIVNLIDNCSILNNTQKTNWKKYWAWYSIAYKADYLSTENNNILKTGWIWTDETYLAWYDRYYQAMYEYYYGTDKTTFINMIGDVTTDEIQSLNNSTYEIWQNIDTIISKYETDGEIQSEVIPGYTTATDKVITNSFVVGTNNSANHYNSYVFGTNNITESVESAKYTGDDGFVVAIGLGNYAARNYDMAVGYNAIASGGENIVIGAAPRDLQNNQSKSIGYKNFNIRSLVNGVGNIGIDSYIPLNFTAYHGQTSYQYKNTNNTYKRTNINNITYYGYTDEDPGKYLSINNNIITNTNISNMTTDYVNNNIIANSEFNFSSYDFNNNFIFDFNGNITGRFNENVIFNTPSLYYKNTDDNYSMAFNFIYNASINADIKTSFSENILLPCTNIEVTSNLFARNLVYNSKIYQDEISGLGEIRDNIVHHSKMYATYGCYDNMLCGTIANDLTGCFSFTDYMDSDVSRLVANIQQSVRIYNFGDNHIFQGMDSFVVGQQNSASYINNSYIHGRRNFIKSYTGTSSFPCYYNHGKMFENLLIFGDENEFSSKSGSNTRINNNRIIGNHNKIHEPNRIMNTNVIGDNNNFGCVTLNGAECTATVNDLFDNRSNYYAAITGNTAYYTSSNNIYDCYVNGARNIIGSYINGAYILGNNNLVYTKNIPNGTSDSYCDNIKIFGNFNLSRGGSNQLAIGFGNELSGHFAMAVGDTLKTSGSQLIVGKFNAPVDAAVRDGITYDFATSSVVPLEQSGVLFAVGNGTYNVTEGYTGTNLRKGYVDKNNNPVSEYSLMDEQYIERSNAMIVSADGTVSATKFSTPEVPDIGSSLNELQGIITLLQNKPTTGKHVIGVDNGVLSWIEINQ